MKYISIDLETTGTDWNKHQIIEFGAIFEDTDKKLSYEEIPKFHRIIEYETIIGHPFALNMNSRIFELMVNKPKDTKFTTIDNLTYEFVNWLWEIDEFTEYDPSKIYKFTAAGKNFGTFDKNFIEKIPNWTKMLKIHQRVIDPAQYFVDWKNDQSLPNTTECAKRANITLENHHHALFDAWTIIQLLRTQY